MAKGHKPTSAKIDSSGTIPLITTSPWRLRGWLLHQLDLSWKFWVHAMIRLAWVPGKAIGAGGARVQRWLGGGYEHRYPDRGDREVSERSPRTNCLRGLNCLRWGSMTENWTGTGRPGYMKRLSGVAWRSPSPWLTVMQR